MGPTLAVLEACRLLKTAENCTILGPPCPCGLQLAFTRLLIQGVRIGFQDPHPQCCPLPLLTCIQRQAAGLGRA